MRIDGSGTGAWNRDREAVTFGTKTWREYTGATAGATRARADMAGRDRARHDAQGQSELIEAERLAEFEHAAERLAAEYAAELAGPALRWNAGARAAYIVRVAPAAGLDETSAQALLSAGFRFSARRGGMFWAPRSPQAEHLAASVCEWPAEFTE